MNPSPRWMKATFAKALRRVLVLMSSNNARGLRFAITSIAVARSLYGVRHPNIGTDQKIVVAALSRRDREFTKNF
jgi:hypothetical protein